MFKSVCKASVINPPKHLGKTILMGSQFNSSKVPSLQWGISHEDEARKAYVNLMEEHHANFECCSAGLHVNPKFPHLVASPDDVTAVVRA